MVANYIVLYIFLLRQHKKINDKIIATLLLSHEGNEHIAFTLTCKNIRDLSK